MATPCKAKTHPRKPMGQHNQRGGEIDFGSKELAELPGDSE